MKCPFSSSCWDPHNSHANNASSLKALGRNRFDGGPQARKSADCCNCHSGHCNLKSNHYKKTNLFQGLIWIPKKSLIHTREREKTEKIATKVTQNVKCWCLNPWKSQKVSFLDFPCCRGCLLMELLSQPIFCAPDRQLFLKKMGNLISPSLDILFIEINLDQFSDRF